ncbi:TonB-dependent receptor [Joostella atrarenae]|uniref:TonB-dependent receptor n=1 Tax=Joostella atrarenae TaxID=679257 RepID=A0ABS9J5C7_9FLAO|nr:TonB-dependent receptor [Joostella atrarenae]MCF8715627.1 TonB-dependent receptor [Joostella atrarenae]
MTTTFLFAQEKVVKGNVVDGSGVPVPGVSVLIKGTSMGVATDFDGNYEITTHNTDAVLVFSFMGFLSQEKVVGSQDVVNVVMKEDVAQLDEVVVVGYGTQKKENVSGAISTIKSEELTKVPASNTTQLITGRVAGVITQQSSSLPGGDDASISIRGFGDPLVIVDGVQTTMGNLDPNNIESITVLKDASAAIYGARAGNGVLLVTTKRGTRQKPSITYTGTTSFANVSAYQKTVNAAQYVELKREQAVNTQTTPEFSEEDLENYRNGAPGYESYNWADELYQNGAPMFQHNLNVSGGSENVKYFTSVGYLEQESIFSTRDFDFKRYNIRSNVDVELSEQFGVAMDISYRNELTDRAASGATTNANNAVNDIYTELLTAQPIWNPYLPDPSYGAAYSGFLERNPLAISDKDLDGTYNYDNRVTTFRLEGEYRVKAVPGLKLKGVMNIIRRTYTTKTFALPYDLYSYEEEDDEYLYWSTSNQGQNRLSQEAYNSDIISPQLSVEYDRTFNEKHKVSGLFLAEGRSVESEILSATRQELISENIPILNTGSDINKDNGGSQSESGRMSYVGRVNYSFNNKYNFSVTGRYDANAYFAPDTRWGFFPSVLGSWVISKENFLRDSNVVNNLKLRLSYTNIGDDRNISGYEFLPGYNIVNGNFLIGDEVKRQVVTLGLPNNEVTWEDIKLYNIGVDATFWNGKLGIEADVFLRDKSGILTTPLVALPDTFGAALPLVNLNSTQTKGFEVLLTHRSTIGNVRLNISPSFGYSRTKYTHFEEEEYTDPDDVRIYQRTGNFTDRRTGYISDGMFMNQDEIDNLAYDQDQQGNVTLRPGDIRYKDINEDGVIDYRDQDVIGRNSRPNVTYAANIGLQYKNFSFSALLQGASQFDVNIVTAARNMFQNGSIPYDFHYKYRWSPSEEDPLVNDNPNAQLPMAFDGGTSNNNKTSDFWVKDATYLRLKQVNLAYTIPSTKNSGGISNIQLSLAATNLFTWSKLGIYKNFLDPENNLANGRAYPITSAYTFGVKFNIN